MDDVKSTNLGGCRTRRCDVGTTRAPSERRTVPLSALAADVVIPDLKRCVYLEGGRAAQSAARKPAMIGPLDGIGTIFPVVAELISNRWRYLPVERIDVRHFAGMSIFDPGVSHRILLRRFSLARRSTDRKAVSATMGDLRFRFVLV